MSSQPLTPLISLKQASSPAFIGAPTLIAFVLITMLFSAAAAAGLAATSADIDNLLANPGFEKDMDGWAVGFGGDGTTNTIDTAMAHTGLKSYYTRSDDKTQRIGAVQDIHAPAPGVYSVSAFFHARNVEATQPNHGVLIRVQYQDEHNQHVKDIDHIVGDIETQSVWTPLRGDIVVPAGTHRMRVELYTWYATGEVWWDDVSVKPIQLDADNANATPPNDEQQTDPAAPHGDNLVRNGDFSEGSAGWSTWTPQGEPTMTVDQSVYHSAPASYKVQGHTPSDRAALVQSVPVEPGQRYRLSFWAKTEQVTEGRAYVRLQFDHQDDASQKTRSHLHVGPLPTTTDWTQWEETFTTPENTGALRIEPFLDAGEGTVWWDDLQLVAIEQPPLEITTADAVVHPSGTVHLQWHIPDEYPSVSYRVYRGLTPTFNVGTQAPIGVVHDTKFIDRNTGANRTYYYKIVPVDMNGQEGTLSKPVSAQVKDVADVKAVHQLHAHREGDSVRLSWQLTPDARARQIRLERGVRRDSNSTDENAYTWQLIGLAPAWTDDFVDQTVPKDVDLAAIVYRATVLSPDGTSSTAVTTHLTGFVPTRAAVPADTYPSLFITAAEIDDIKKAADDNPAIRALIESEIVRKGRGSALAYLTRTITLPPKGDNSAHSSMAAGARNAALAYAFSGDVNLATGAKNVLMAYAREYKSYPLQQSHDGRVTTQTLNESPWLIDLVWAYDLIMSADILTAEEKSLIENDLFRNAVAVIQRYPKGLSNWQAWHNAAKGAVAVVLRDEQLLDRVIHGHQGFTYHMREGLRGDGLWWEQAIGYHNYTRRALFYLAEAVYRHGYDLYAYEAHGQSLKSTLDAPLYHAHTHLDHPVIGNTSPSSKLAFDWTYGIGYLRYNDPRYVWLAQKTGYTTGSFPNVLFLSAFAPEEGGHPVVIGFNAFAPAGFNVAGSTLLADTGMVLLRPAVSMPEGPEVTLLYKPHGTTIGHQAPDNLTITLTGHGSRWLSGPGSFNYDRHEQGTWYKQTIARNGIVVDERSQLPQDLGTEIFAGDSRVPSTGKLTHFVAMPSVAAAGGETSNVYPGVQLQRTLFVTDGFTIDRYEARSDTSRQYDWVLNVTADEGELSIEAQHEDGTLGTRAGYQHVTDVRRGVTDNQWHGTWTKRSGHTFHVDMIGGTTTEVIRGTAFGPSLSRQPILVARRQQQETEFVAVMHVSEGSESALVVTPYASDNLTGVEVFRPYSDGDNTGTLTRALWPQRGSSGSSGSNGISQEGDNENVNGADLWVTATGEQFQGAMALFQTDEANHTSSMVALDATYAAADGRAITSENPTDLAVEWTPEGPVTVAQFGDSDQVLQLSLPATATSPNVYRLKAANDGSGRAAVEGVDDFDKATARTGETILRWKAEPNTLYVLADEQPDEQWLERLVTFIR